MTIAGLNVSEVLELALLLVAVGALSGFLAGLFGIGVILVLGKAGFIQTGPLSWVIDCSIWALSLVFLLRAVGNLRSFGFFKTIKETPFAHWDTWLYSPLCLLLATLAAGLASSPRQR